MDPQHTQHIWFLDTVVLYWTRDDRLFVSYGYDFQLLTPVAFDTIHGDPHVMNTEYRFQLVRSQNIVNAQNCIVRNNEYYRLPTNIVESSLAAWYSSNRVECTVPIVCACACVCVFVCVCVYVCA